MQIQKMEPYSQREGGVRDWGGGVKGGAQKSERPTHTPTVRKRREKELWNSYVILFSEKT